MIFIGDAPPCIDDDDGDEVGEIGELKMLDNGIVLLFVVCGTTP